MTMHSILGSAEYQGLFKNAMKLGSIEAEITKILLYGAAGTGKSSFMDLIVGNPPRHIRISTPLAVRPVNLFQLDTSSKKWKKLSFKEQKEFITRAIVHLKAQLELASSSEEDDSSSEEEQLEGKPVPIERKLKL